MHEMAWRAEPELKPKPEPEQEAARRAHFEQNKRAPRFKATCTLDPPIALSLSQTITTALALTSTRTLRFAYANPNSSLNP